MIAACCRRPGTRSAYRIGREVNERTPRRDPKWSGTVSVGTAPSGTDSWKFASNARGTNVRFTRFGTCRTEVRLASHIPHPPVPPWTRVGREKEQSFPPPALPAFPPLGISAPWGSASPVSAPKRDCRDVRLTHSEPVLRRCCPMVPPVRGAREPRSLLAAQRWRRRSDRGMGERRLAAASPASADAQRVKRTRMGGDSARTGVPRLSRAAW